MTGVLSLVACALTVGASGAVVSMVTGTVVAALVLPAGSVAVTVMLFSPVPRAVVGVTDQVPSAATTAVLTSPPGKVTVMVSPATPAPLMVGVVSLVMLSVLLAPVSLAAATSASGAAGGVVSMVTGTVVAGLVLPAGSVAVTLMLFRPSSSGLVGVTLQTPLTTVTVLTSPPGKVTVMVSPLVPVPLMVGVASLVMPSSLVLLSLAGSSTAAGAAGALVSMVRGKATAGPVLPAGSVAVTLRVFRPSGSVVVVALQLPLASTKAVAMTLPAASLMVMVSPGAPVP